MAKLTIDINGDTRALQMLDRMEKRLSSPAKELKAVGEMAISEFTQNFPQEGKRLDEPWKKLAPSTIKQRARLGYGPHPILVRTGRLMTGWKQEVKKFLVRIYNPIPYFKYHQKGGGHLPQRRMLIVNERIKQEVVAIFADWLRKLPKA